MPSGPRDAPMLVMLSQLKDLFVIIAVTTTIDEYFQVSVSNFKLIEMSENVLCHRSNVTCSLLNEY